MKSVRDSSIVVACLALLILLACNPTAQQEGTTCGGSGDDFGYSIQPTPDGGFVICGATASFGAGGKDVYLIKTNASGDTLWTRTYGGAADDEGNSVIPTSDGGYLVAGFTNSLGAGSYDAYLIRTNSLGDTLWTRTYGGAQDDRANSVQPTPDSGYIFVGQTMSFGAYNYNVWLVKVNAGGDVVWSRAYGGSNDDKGNSVLATSDGYVVVGFTASFGAGDYDVYLLRLTAAGDTLWTRTFGGAKSDQGFSVAPTADGGYVAAGYANSFTIGNTLVYLIKVDAQGDRVWTRTYGFGANWAMSVQKTGDNGFILAGASNSSDAGGLGVYLIKTDAAGDTQWTCSYGGAGDDRGFSVALTPDGGYAVAGSTNSYGAGGQDVYLIKTDAQGNAEN
jgi:hypothetical protein